ncbi:hypothetical protein [Corynebacterium sp. A21]|uniref:hypothetical protein n=1 Tax=Corynebacterium sp. A21 TaxID=3457318 RepID=UPI003FCF72E8
MLKHRKIGVLAASGTLALLLGGCAAAEPGTAQQASANTLVIAVITDTPDSTEQMVLGELYQRALEESERDVVIDVIAANESEHGISRLGDTFSDLTIGCTGDLLTAFHPDRAREIAAEIKAHPEQDFRQATYEALIGALPAHFDAPDPSPAEGCGGTKRHNGLPENIVPVFEKDSIARSDLEALNQLGRSLSTEAIRMIVDEARERGSVSGAVDDYFSGRGSFTGGGDARQEQQEA